MCGFYQGFHSLKMRKLGLTVLYFWACWSGTWGKGPGPAEAAESCLVASCGLRLCVAWQKPVWTLALKCRDFGWPQVCPQSRDVSLGMHCYHKNFNTYLIAAKNSNRDLWKRWDSLIQNVFISYLNRSSLAFWNHWPVILYLKYNIIYWLNTKYFQVVILKNSPHCPTLVGWGRRHSKEEVSIFQWLDSNQLLGKTWFFKILSSSESKEPEEKRIAD